MANLKAIFYRDWANDYIPSIVKEMYIDSIYSDYEKKGAVVLDIGANVGMFSHYAYPWASKIYAIEPSELHFETLNKMLDFNEMKDKVVPVKSAISNYKGKTKFYHFENTTMYSMSDAAGKTPGIEGFEEVDVITLKDLFEEHKIEHVDLAKVDVEGEETKIFSSDEFKEVAPKIDVIFTEWHRWTNISIDNLVSAFRDQGYKVLKCATQADVLIATRI